MDELIKVKSPKIKEEAKERDRKKANNNDNKQRDITHRQILQETCEKPQTTTKPKVILHRLTMHSNSSLEIHKTKFLTEVQPTERSQSLQLLLGHWKQKDISKLGYWSRHIDIMFVMTKRFLILLCESITVHSQTGLQISKRLVFAN